MIAALTGAGLSAAAGLNAFIPLVIVGLFARFTDVITLPAELMWLQSWPTLIIALLLLAADVVLDKIPGVDHVNDLIQTAVRPLVGGVIFAATSAAAELDGASFWSDNPLIAGVVGAIITAIVHTAKAASRPAVNAATGGTGAPLASFAEDAVAVALSFLAIFIPFLVVLVFIAMGIAVYRIVTTGRRRRRHKELLQTERRQAREADEAEREATGGTRRERWRAWTREYRERIGGRSGDNGDHDGGDRGTGEAAALEDALDASRQESASAPPAGEDRRPEA